MSNKDDKPMGTQPPNNERTNSAANSSASNSGKTTPALAKLSQLEKPSQLELGDLAPADMDDSTLRSTVVGEYVLGTLASTERRACEALFECSAEWAEEKRLWEVLLAEFAGAQEPVEPPQSVLARVRRQIGLSSGPQGLAAGNTATGAVTSNDHIGNPSQNSVQNVGRGLTFWRASTAISALAAGIMAIALFSSASLPFSSQPTQVADSTQQGGENYIAMLQDPESKVYWLINYLPESGEIELRRQGSYALRPDRDLQLWWAPPEGKPTSVTILPRTAEQSIRLPLKIPTDSHFGISLEPRGGSDIGKPSGPVLALADLIKL